MIYIIYINKTVYKFNRHAATAHKKTARKSSDFLAAGSGQGPIYFTLIAGPDGQATDGIMSVHADVIAPRPRQIDDARINAALVD